MRPRPSPALDLGLAPAFQSLLDGVSGRLESEEGVGDALWESAILEPSRSILTRTGKGIRAGLLEHSWALAGGTPERLPTLLPICIELIHAGSLIVDDIEDDSHRRRGAPALHRSHGVPVALNTGNWLYFLAADLVADLPLGADVRLALMEDLMRSLRRCHEGQALDLSVHVGHVRKRDVGRLVETATRLKTGSLMGLAARMGARAAGASAGTVETIGAFGADVGVGLQMLDDWSGIDSPARREKGLEDLRLGRPTWPWAWLAASSDDLTFQEAARQSREISLDWQAEGLLERLRHVVKPAAREAITDRFDRALLRLQDQMRATPAYERVAADVRSMMDAYD